VVGLLSGIEVRWGEVLLYLRLLFYPALHAEQPFPVCCSLLRLPHVLADEPLVVDVLHYMAQVVAVMR
jgi:hypothetical protein